MLGGGPRWRHQILSAQDPAREEAIRRAMDRIAKAVAGYVAGVLVQATIAGVTSWIVLTILGVPFAGALALIIALFDLIPLVGATIGAILVGIITLFVDFPTATIVWIIYSVVYQQVENTVIQPQIQNRAVEIQPFFVLVSVLFASTLFGVLGALLAIPVASMIQVILRDVWDHRRGRPKDEPTVGEEREPVGDGVGNVTGDDGRLGATRASS
jgi:predicted PurR-regulated permease PerM